MTLGCIGAGKMAEAMLADMLATHTVDADQVLACDVTAERREHMASAYGFRVTDDAAATMTECDTILLAVKPQQLDAVMEDVANAATPDHLVMSIAAGKKLERLESLWPQTRMFRVMPNLAVQASAGMSVFCAGRSATEADRETVARLLGCFGRVLELPEEQMDAVTALSGSGPAFCARFLGAMVDGAVALGLEPADAKLLAAQTMFGTAKLLLEGKFEIDALVAAVTSKKGTTAAGLEVMDGGDLSQLMADTLAAAAARSRELSG